MGGTQNHHTVPNLKERVFTLLNTSIWPAVVLFTISFYLTQTTLHVKFITCCHTSMQSHLCCELTASAGDNPHWHQLAIRFAARSAAVQTSQPQTRLLLLTNMCGMLSCWRVHKGQLPPSFSNVVTHSERQLLARLIWLKSVGINQSSPQIHMLLQHGSEQRNHWSSDTFLPASSGRGSSPALRGSTGWKIQRFCCCSWCCWTGNSEYTFTFQQNQTTLG